MDEKRKPTTFEERRKLQRSGETCIVNPECIEILSAIREQTVSISGRLLAVESQMNKLQETIIGNGKPGFMVRVDRLEQTESRRSRQLWALWSIIAAFIIGGGGWVATQIIQHLAGVR